MPPNQPDADIADRLRRWHAGDAVALDELLVDELPWIRRLVERRTGAILRRAESGSDLVQEVVLSILRRGPRFLIADRQQLRAFLARVTENVILDRHGHLSARRRDRNREAPLPSRESVLVLDGSVRSATSPSEAAAAEEQRALLWIGLRLLDPIDRALIEMRDYQELSFADIAARLETTADAARMRYHRALPKLAQTLWDLRNRRLAAALAHTGEQAAAHPESTHPESDGPEPIALA